MKNSKILQFMFTMVLMAIVLTAVGLSPSLAIPVSCGAGILSLFVVIPDGVLGTGALTRAKELRESAAKINKQINDILDKEDYSDDDDAQYEKLFEEQAKLLKRAEAIEKQEKLKAQLEHDTGQSREFTPEGPSDPKKEAEENEKKYSDAFLKYVRFGFSELDAEERALIRKRYVTAQSRGQSTTTTEGGYTIPEGFSNELEKMLKFYGGMMEAARIFGTDSGNAIPWPTLDDTANKGRLLAEEGDASAGTTDMVFGQKMLNAYKYTSDLLLVSSEVLQDSAFDFGSIIMEALAERLGRILNEHFTTADGNDKPNGVVTASAKGADAAAAAITFDNIIDLYHGVNRSYRGNARWMLNDNTLKAIRKLKDDNNNYIWQMHDVRTGEPSTILGKPYTVNDDMPDIEADAKSLLFGDFSKYIIRRVNGIMLKRANERYIETDQVAFVGFARFDGELINTSAVKHLLHAST